MKYVDLKELMKLRARWRTFATKQKRMRQKYTDRESVCQSYGMDIAYDHCANELDRIIGRYK